MDGLNKILPKAIVLYALFFLSGAGSMLLAYTILLITLYTIGVL